MKDYLEKHRKIIGLAAALIACAIAVLYIWLVPNEASHASGIQKIVLVYGHSLCWFLLSTASVLWATKKRSRWLGILMYTALATYITYIGVLLATN